MIGEGVGNLLSLAFNMIKPALPKIASTIGLSGLTAGITHGINKALNKNNIIKLSDKQVNDINKNLDIINKSKIFNKKNYIVSKWKWHIFNTTSNACKYYCSNFN